MRAGKLRHKVDLQKQTTSDDPNGQPIILWTTYATVWSNISNSSGNENVNQDVAQAYNYSNITIRYMAGISTTDRVKFGDRYFEINSIDNVENMDKEIVLECSEVGN